MSAIKNAMELLVEEEVQKQYKSLSPKVASYINPLELVAYALNQLPALYATSEKGLEHQVKRGKAIYAPQIAQAVQRAIAAIRRDPLRTCIPLQLPQQTVPLREVLHQMRLLLRNDKIDWETLPTAVEQALDQAFQRGMTWDVRYAVQSSPYGTPRSARRFTVQSEIWGSQTPADSLDHPLPDSFDWDDPLYHSR